MHETRLRHDGRVPEVVALFELPFFDLLYRAQQVHRRHFNPHEVQLSTLLSIKTGAAPRTVSIVRKASAMTPASMPMR